MTVIYMLAKPLSLSDSNHLLAAVSITANPSFLAYIYTRNMYTCTDRQGFSSVAVLHRRRRSWASLQVCNDIIDLGVIWNLQKVRNPACLE